MIQVDSGEITSSIKALFRESNPASLRCFAVLDGRAAGRVWVDDLTSPTWGILQEAGFRSIYIGGEPDTGDLQALVRNLQAEGELLVGLHEGDPRFNLLPPNADYTGKVLEFTDRADGKGLDAWLKGIPQGCELLSVDRSLFERCLERDLLIQIYGSAEAALSIGFGLCLVRDGQVLSEAHAGPTALGMIEIGTMTHERHQYRGYATLPCAHLVRACEKHGYHTYWNCNWGNKASVAIARKLGYRTMVEYELRAWFLRV